MHILLLFSYNWQPHCRDQGQLLVVRPVFKGSVGVFQTLSFNESIAPNTNPRKHCEHTHSVQNRLPTNLLAIKQQYDQILVTTHIYTHNKISHYKIMLGLTSLCLAYLKVFGSFIPQPDM